MLPFPPTQEDRPGRGDPGYLPEAPLAPGLGTTCATPRPPPVDGLKVGMGAGEGPCSDEAGDQARKKSDDSLDEALKETFPASDPVAPFIPAVPAKPRQDHGPRGRDASGPGFIGRTLP